MSKMKREPCPVCGQSVAVNWHSREMDYHRRRFPGELKLLVNALSEFNLDSLGPNKYGKTAQDIIQSVAALSQLLPRAERECLRAA